MSVADDPLIPLITTVLTSGRGDDARAYLQRQHDRLSTGAGYSFAIADAHTGDAARNASAQASGAALACLAQAARAVARHDAQGLSLDAVTTSLDELPRIGSPATRALHAAGYTVLRQLADVPRSDLARLHGMGPKALRILEDALAEHGLRLG